MINICAGIRDFGILTDGVDPRSSIIVKYIINAVNADEEKQKEPEPSLAPVTHGLRRQQSFGTASRDVLARLQGLRAHTE